MSQLEFCHFFSVLRDNTIIDIDGLNSPLGSNTTFKSWWNHQDDDEANKAAANFKNENIYENVKIQVSIKNNQDI